MPFVYLSTKTLLALLLTFQFARSDSSVNGSSFLNDPMYPGTAVLRMLAARERVGTLSTHNLSADWEQVRKKILWAAGLKDLQDVAPGKGYTGHSFNDWNHVDATCMLENIFHGENEGRVAGIASRNRLGEGIIAASDPDLGEGGSWSTCMMGCDSEPPRDVAHIQFQSRIAFKLVWCPPAYDQFVLVDDDGQLLAWGQPTGLLPSLRDRTMNYMHVKNSKYGVNAFARDSGSCQANDSGTCRS